MPRPKSTQCARGSWQREKYDLLVAGYTVSSPTFTVVGKGRDYVNRYMASFRRLLVRMEAQGWTIERIPGVRGGEWGARYRATHREENVRGT